MLQENGHYTLSSSADVTHVASAVKVSETVKAVSLCWLVVVEKHGAYHSASHIASTDMEGAGLVAFAEEWKILQVGK